MMYQTYEGMDIEGTVLRIEKSSIFDGDGLRTVFNSGELSKENTDNA